MHLIQLILPVFRYSEECIKSSRYILYHSFRYLMAFHSKYFQKLASFITVGNTSHVYTYQGSISALIFGEDLDKTKLNLSEQYYLYSFYAWFIWGIGSYETSVWTIPYVFLSFFIFASLINFSPLRNID